MEFGFETRCELAQWVKISGVIRSSFKVALWCLVLALWFAVGQNRDTRELLRLHGRAALAPRSFDFRFPFDNSPRVDLQMSDAEEELDWPRLRALVEANPRDATLLATAVRRDAVGFRSSSNRVGPLVGPYPNWSVQLGYNYPASPVGAPGPGVPAPPPAFAPIPTLPPSDVARFLGLVRRGQALEPQNTFWDWMEMAALVNTGRERELDAIARRAARKSVFDDHISEALRARIALFKRQKAGFAPGVTVEAYASQLLPHLSPIRTTTQFLAQRVMGLRLQHRDDEALSLGMDCLRLARMIRLQATTPITSHVGKRCEQIIIRNARVPLGKPPRFLSKSPLAALAANRATLLFLARARSSPNAVEIATEWSRIARWNVASSPYLFGGLVTRRTLLGVGWTTRAAAFIAASLPAALLMWALFALVSRIAPTKVAPVSPRLAMWGAALGSAFVAACVVFDWFIANTGFGLESWAVLWQSLLFGVRLPWGGVTLLLLWLALWPRPRVFAPAPKRRIEDWEQPLLDTVPFQLLDRLNGALRWFARTVVPLIFGMAFIGWACALFLVWPEEIPARLPLGSAKELFYLSLSLVVLPALWVGLRELQTWHRTRKLRLSPLLFAARGRSLLGGYLLVALLLLPVLLWAQSRFERDFNREFAPIERGQMISAMQKMRGLPMQ